MHNTESFSQRWRAARACARCRRLKSRCVYETPAHASCQKCSALGIPCSVDSDPTARTAKRRVQMKLPSRTRTQVWQKVHRLLAEAEREFSRMPGFDSNSNSNLNSNSDDVASNSDDPNSSDALSESKTDSEIPMQHEAAAAVAAVARRLEIHANQLRSKHVGSQSRDTADSNEPSGLPETELYDQQLPPAAFLQSLIPEAEARARYACFHQQMAVYLPLLMLPHAFQDFAVALKLCPLLVLTCVYVTTTCDRGFSTRAANTELHLRLGPYLDRQLAHTIFVEAANLSHHLVYACMILSLWIVPPSRVHQYKSQIKLITAYSVSVCIDAGTVPGGTEVATLKDNSVERNNLRCFLAVYCSCGSLNFSLPRFNFAAWSPRHEIAVDLLSRNYVDLSSDGHAVPLPSQSDLFLCFYSRVIHAGKEISDLLAETGTSMNLLTAEEERRGYVDSHRQADSHKRSFEKLEAELAVLESRLTKIVAESGVFDPERRANMAPGEKYCLLLTYYQLVMMIHDNLVSWCIHSLTAKPHVQIPDLDCSLVATHIVKFGNACEQILESFVELNAGGITGYPTFFYYRAMAALISLVRLSILVKSDISQRYLPGVHCLKFRLPFFHQEVSRIIEHTNVNYDSKVCEMFPDLLEKIGRWVQIVQNNEHSKPASLDGEVDFLKLTSLSKGQEVEKFTAPRTLAPVHEESSVRGVLFASDNSSSVPDIAPLISNFSMQEMFKEIDEDIVRFLNPFDGLEPGVSSVV